MTVYSIRIKGTQLYVFFDDSTRPGVQWASAAKAHWWHCKVAVHQACKTIGVPAPELEIVEFSLTEVSHQRGD